MNISIVKAAMNRMKEGTLNKDLFDTPEKRLFACVIMQGVIDLTSERADIYQDAAEFFYGDFIKSICNWIGLDYNDIMNNLMKEGLL